MPCLLVLAGLLAPRILILGLWFLTAWFQGMFDSLLWPALGFLFLPSTLLWYGAVQHWFGGTWDLVPIAGLVVALMIDVSPARGGRRKS